MCEYCKLDNKVMHTERCFNCDIEVFIEEDGICVNSYNHQTEHTEDIVFNFPIRFCPMCGRAL